MKILTLSLESDLAIAALTNSATAENTGQVHTTKGPSRPRTTRLISYVRTGGCLTLRYRHGVGTRPSEHTCLPSTGNAHICRI